ncbi:MAG TPA: hypothetical protein VGM78_04840 [Ilumatobacteraceae bacterium]
MKKHFLAAAAIAIAGSLSGGLTTAHANGIGSGNGNGINNGPGNASFEGHTINLADGWGDAKACAVTADGVQCYTSEAEMDAALASEAADASEGLGLQANIAGLSIDLTVSPLATCSTNLKLYDGTSYGGIMVSVASAGTYVNLASFGFDNMTSSYKVGSCYVDMFSSASGGGSIYPGATSPGTSSPSMIAGWNNVVSSVYVY